MLVLLIVLLVSWLVVKVVDVLVLVLYIVVDVRKALVTNVVGDVTELDWKVDGSADPRSFCSLTFKNEMLIYGQVLTKSLFSLFFDLEMLKSNQRSTSAQ